METFQEVAESLGKKEDNKDASDTAGLLEKLNVGDGKTEGKGQEEKPDVAKEEDKQTYKEEDKKAVDDQAKPEAGNKDEPALQTKQSTVGIFEEFINIGVGLGGQ